MLLENILSSKKNYKIPIVLGITGYRDIHKNHYKSLENKVSEIFDNLIEKYPNTPLVLLTPLADGADRIVAYAALQDKYKEKITVSVPLPFDEQNYKDTFAKGITTYKNANDTQKKEMIKESIDEYDSLLDKVNNQTDEYTPKTIPMLFDKELYNKSNDDDKRKIRRKQYSIVGEYIAIHSNILIAMYNFCDDEKKDGGTREVVDKKLSGDYDYFKIKDEDVTYSEDGIVYAISTPKKGTEKFVENYKIVKKFPYGKDEIFDSTKKSDNILTYIKNLFSKPCISSNLRQQLNPYTLTNLQINCFNKEVENNLNQIKEKAKKDIKEVRCANQLIHKNIMIRRSAAYLSRLYKGKMETIEKYILSLIAITIFALMFKSDFPEFKYSFYIDIVYLVLIFLFFITYHKLKSYKEKYEDYRALSESLRIQTAWNMANINSSTALYYLSHQKSELNWIRTAIRGIKIFYLPKTDKEIFSKEQINKYWVDEQIEYFTNNINKHRLKEIRISKKIKFNFMLFLISTVIFSILNFNTNIDQCSISIFNFTIVDFINLIFVGVPFTIASYLKSKQYFAGNTDILREYELSLDIFTKARELIDDPNKNTQKVYINLGIEALRENSSWIITRRTKDYDVPI
jgi:hypothetical protein